MNAVFNYPDHIPDGPETENWSDHLRWMIAVMDDDDKALPFVASCLSHLLKQGALSEKQSMACNKVLARIRGRWMAMTLDCQAGAACEGDEPEGLAAMTPRGAC